MKHFYEELCKAGFKHCKRKMQEYKKKLNLSYNVEDIPKYLEYEIRIANRDRSGVNNPFYGKKHSIESRKKMSISRKGKHTGPSNPFYGKHHSEATKLKQSEVKKEYYKIHINPMLGKLRPYGSTWEGKHHTEETKKKLSVTRSNLLKSGNYYSKYKLDGYSFDSKWEVIYYLYCWLYNKKVERNIHIPLAHGNTFIDFRVDGKLYEIKGPHFFNKQGQLINPFNNPNKVQDEHSREKQECYEKYNVEIITNITPYLEVIRGTKAYIRYVHNTMNLLKKL